MTAYVLTGNITLAKESGMIDHIPKAPDYRHPLKQQKENK